MGKYIFFFVLSCSCILSAQDGIGDTWSIYTSVPPSTLLKSYQKGIKTAVLVRISEAQSAQWFKKSGIRVLRVLDKEHYIVTMDNEQREVFKDSCYITYVNDKWKLSNTLLQGNVTKKAHYVIKSNRPKHTIAHINRLPKITFIKTEKNSVHVYGKLDLLEKELLPNEEVLYVGQESFNPILESTVRDLNLTINNINKIYKALPNLQGEGIIVSLKDNRFIESDIDLRNKLTNSPLISNTTDNHATDMATIISGLGNSSIKGKGVAPMASIQLSDFSNLLPDGNTYLSDNNILIQNHSYGTEIENFYGLLAESYDTHIYQNPEELHVFSSGNAGLDTPKNGPYQGIGNYANLTGNFKMSKNTLSIGAMDEENKVPSFSSVGPAYDGRIKPELVAYSIVGTSNATALVSGVCALLQEFYMDIHNQNPLASLVKAIVINSADDIGNKGPDFRSGYGKINGYNALKTLQDNRIISSTIDPGAIKTFPIGIPQNAKNFKATLVWTDTPAPINSNLALVNDLDMEAINGTTVHEPWVLNSRANTLSLESPASKGPDHTNNIEQVSIENPISGEVVLQVTGFNINTLNQEFSIAYGWEEPNSFTWNYPLLDDNFPYDGETASYFRWEGSFDIEKGELAISYDHGDTWEVIESQTTLSDGYYFWSAPEDITTTALLKMTIAGREHISDPFVISRVSTLGVALDCDDVLQLRWNKQENVKAYNIYNLKDNIMQLTAVTSDTTYIFDKTKIDSDYFAVQSVLQESKLGAVSTAIDYTMFNAGCYESFVFAEISEDGNAGELNIQLSSLFNVARVEIQKEIGTSFETIGVIGSPDRTSLTYLDQLPVQGLNTYRLNIVLNDGTSFISEESELFFLTTVPFTTFPNPIMDGVNIFTKEFEDTAEVWMEIYSLEGRHILSKKVGSDRAFILLNELRPGLYAMVIYSNRGDRLEQLIYKL
ncbi:MAG: S8 family serine peptidase [Bacteroidota bacterium]